MSNLLSRIKQAINGQQSFQWVLYLGISTTLLAIGLYGYLGIFSRYGSDDYCLSAFYYQKGSFVSWMIDRYLQSSSRYTNILFIGLVDKLFGWYNVAFLPPLMLVLFVSGLYLFLMEIVPVASLGWNRPLTLYMTSLIVYFSVAQAPNLYEILYWRAGMTSHFAPLVFLTFLGAFILNRMRATRVHPPSFWVLTLCFIASFVIGGFSEPPTALMITILVLSIFGVWLRGDAQSRRYSLRILAWSLAGFVLALAVLALAPANAIRLEKAPPGLFDLMFRTFRYPTVFIMDVFRSFPIPALVSIFLLGLLFLVFNSTPPKPYLTVTRNRIIFLMGLVAVLAYLLIASSFAPSVYGQSYPVPRARFAAQVILTCALMMEGALIGIWIANTSTRYLQSTNLRFFIIVLLMLMSLYPLRTVLRNSMDIPVYRERAQAWDLRDARIRELKAEGVRDLVVPFLSREITQDLGDRTGFRLNRCASIIYGVDSILAVPMDQE